MPEIGCEKYMARCEDKTRRRFPRRGRSPTGKTPNLGVSGLLIRVNMPYDVVRQAVYAVACRLGHLGEAFGFGLVLEWVAWEVDAWAC